MPFCKGKMQNYFGEITIVWAQKRKSPDKPDSFDYLM